ncbi:MAG: hypothetical protein ACM3JB_02390 [Acidobacteriaceae bacterium]
MACKTAWAISAFRLPSFSDRIIGVENNRMVIVANPKSEQYAALINEYWQRDKRGRFENSIQELAERYNIPRTQDVTAIIRTNCSASVTWQCPSCEATSTFEIETRNDISNLRLDAKNHVCESCEAERKAKELEFRKQFYPEDSEDDDAGPENIGPNGAIVHVEMGDSSHRIRLTKITECGIKHTRPEAGGIVQCEIVLKGTVVSEDLTEVPPSITDEG